jgi:hypothetical protein
MAIQRTALTPDAKKIGRKMLGPARDAAIMLDPIDRGDGILTIAEGLETAMTGRQLGIGRS